MILRRAILAIALSFLALALPPLHGTATAQDCVTGSGNLFDEVEVYLGGDCDKTPTLGDQTSSPEWRRGAVSGEEGCVPQRFFNNRTGQFVLESNCVFNDLESQAPPVPPSTVDVWDRASREIPVPAVNVVPRNKGLVGYQGAVWYDQDLSITVDASVPGFTVIATVEPVWFRWVMGDGDVVEGPDPGDEDGPHNYVYEESCLDCPVDVTVTWGGSYTMSGPGFGPITVDLGTRPFTGTLDYPVREVEAVLD